MYVIHVHCIYISLPVCIIIRVHYYTCIYIIIRDVYTCTLVDSSILSYLIRSCGSPVYGVYTCIYLYNNNYIISAIEGFPDRGRQGTVYMHSALVGYTDP